MADNEQVQFRSEGEPAFPTDPENDNSADSPSDETKTDNSDASSDAGNKKPDAQNKDVPFDQHPDWIAREQKWDKRFNDQETRHQDDIKAMREEFGGKRKANAEQTDIPSWFGGNQEAWDAYREHEDSKLKQAEDRAYERLTQNKANEDKAVAEATTYMQSEVAAIESDKTLNPTGAKIDTNKLVKIAVDNDCVDSKGRWNWRTAFAIYQTQATKTNPNKGNRKDIAAASGSDPSPEKSTPAYKTSADFKKPGARPW